MWEHPFNKKRRLERAQKEFLGNAEANRKTKERFDGRLVKEKET